MRTLSHRIITLTPGMMSGRTYRQKVDRPRSPGVHEAAVNRYLAQGAGKLDDDDKLELSFPRFSDTLYPTLPAVGVMWEDFWASLYPEEELIWQTEEWCRDGVYGTPDGLMTRGTASTRIAECKGTYKSIRPIEHEKNWLYVKQGLAFCAMNPYGIREVEYHVMWFIHDYKVRPYTPVYTETVVEFSRYEVETWWERMLAVKEKVKPE